jgi:hypothetical protein
MKKMSNRLKHNLMGLGIYSVIAYILLLPLKLWVVSIGIALLIGFLFGLLNDIITQLRKLNGEKFPDIEDEQPDELIKG